MPEARLFGGTSGIFLHPDVGPWPGVWSECVCAWVRKSPPVTGVAGRVQQGHSTLHGASAPFWAPHSARVWTACGLCVPPVRLCSTGGLRQRLGMKRACGTAEPGPLGPSLRRWLGSARFPGPGFPLTPPGRRGSPLRPSSPTPTPRSQECSSPAQPASPRAGPWGLPQPRLLFPGAREGATRAGRLGSSPLLIPGRNSSEVPSGSGFPK